MVSISCCALMFLLLIHSLGAVELQKKGAKVTIKTDMYEVDWKSSESMGYNRAVIPGVRDSILEGDGNVFYHWSDYAGGPTKWSLSISLKMSYRLSIIALRHTKTAYRSFSMMCM